jgi:hypothetical protein
LAKFLLRLRPFGNEYSAHERKHNLKSMKSMQHQQAADAAAAIIVQTRQYSQQQQQQQQRCRAWPGNYNRTSRFVLRQRGHGSRCCNY